MKLCDNVGDTLYFPMTLPDCHISLSRYSPLSLEVVEKLNKCKSFWSSIFSWGTTQTILQHIVSATYRPPFDKVWLSSVCSSPSAKPGNEVECGIYGGWVKTTDKFEAICGPKFMSFWDMWQTPCSLQRSCPLMYIIFRSVDIGRYSLKLPLSCEIAIKVFFGPRFIRGRDTPDFRHAFSNYTYFRPCGRIWFSSVKRAQTLEGK